MTRVDVPPPIFVHATAIVIGEAGILIRGPAGAGKSTVAASLMRLARADHGFAALVGDDRVRLRPAAGRLIAEGIATTAGLLEVRGVGIVSTIREPAAVVRLVVDLGEGPRMPEEGAGATALCGIYVPRITVNKEVAAGVTYDRLRCLNDTPVTVC